MTAADPTVATGQSGPPSAAVRIAGLLGILGGAWLVSVFVVTIPFDVNTLRLIAFNVGAIAVAAAVLTQLAAAGRRSTVVTGVAGAAIAANAWYLVMVAVSSVASIPIGPGPFGVLAFWAGLAMWLADAAFGVVAIRLGGWARLGAIALAVGSLLAITGMDRLELTTRAHPTIFLQLSLIGIALNGAGWIVLGLWLVFRHPEA